jgi:hypothetical protein
MGETLYIADLPTAQIESDTEEGRGKCEWKRTVCGNYQTECNKTTYDESRLKGSIFCPECNSQIVNFDTQQEESMSDDYEKVELAELDEGDEFKNHPNSVVTWCVDRKENNRVCAEHKKCGVVTKDLRSPKDDVYISRPDKLEVEIGCKPVKIEKSDTSDRVVYVEAFGQRTSISIKAFRKHLSEMDNFLQEVANND